MSRGIRVGIPNQVVIRKLTVVEVEKLTPNMRRVVLGGEDLAGVALNEHVVLDPMRSTGFDDRLLILLPEPGQAQTVLPIQHEGRIANRSDGQVGIRRAYTVRRWDAEKALLTIDFVLHGHGPAAVWATSCEPGDTLHVLGPGICHTPPTGVDWLLIAGDETALPAIARWLEEMDDDTVADVFVEVESPAHTLELVAPHSVSVTWLFRGGTPVSRSTLLADAVEAHRWREGVGFAWVAAEAGVVRAIRSHLLVERSMPRNHVQADGYWRASPITETELSDHEADEADEDATGLAHSLNQLDLFPRAAPVRIHAAGAGRIRDELAACRPDLRIEGKGPGVVLVHLDEELPITELQTMVDAAAADMHAEDTLLIATPTDCGPTRSPVLLEPAAEHDLGWLGDVVVLRSRTLSAL